MSAQNFSRILVPTDGSKESMEAADLAIGVAKKYGSQVTAIHVINIDQYIQALGLYRVNYPDTIKKKVGEAKQEASKWLAEIQEKGMEHGITVDTEIIDTPLSIVASIVNYAEREHADLIVIGTRGRSGFAKLLLGSVASGVVTYAACHVMVAK